MIQSRFTWKGRLLEFLACLVRLSQDKSSSFFNKTITKQQINLSVVGFLKIIKTIGNPNKNARNTAQLKGGIEASFEFILIF
ncbi:hypothetical protein KVK66_06175 [Helicobacter pylori]|nr:hypothetical protein KVK66_06175 [Helicobacter pylori]